MPKEDKQDRTYLVIIDKLMEYFEQNNYKPGDRLPSEDVLASELYFGRPALREALRVLEMMGVIESTRGRSNIYSKNMSKGLLSIFTVFSSVYDGAFEGIMQLRADIEVIGVESFVKNATEMDIMELEFITHKYLTETEDNFVSCKDDRAHIEFHQTLLKYSASEFEKEFVALSICMRVLSPRIASAQEIDKERIKLSRAYRTHYDLIDAIKARDVERAKTIARNHALYYTEMP